MIAEPCTSSPNQRPQLQLDPQTGLPFVALSVNRTASTCATFRAAGSVTVPVTPGSLGMTIMLVVRMQSALSPTGGMSREVYLDLQASNYNDRIWISRGSTGVRFLYRTAASDTLWAEFDGSLQTGRFEIFTFRMAEGTFTGLYNHVVNITQQVTSANFTNVDTTYSSVLLGRDANMDPNNPMAAMSIRDVLIYNRPLSDVEMNLVYEQLVNKWRLPPVQGERFVGQPDLHLPARSMHDALAHVAAMLE